MIDFKDVKYPIEHLVFVVDEPNKMSEFIELDHEIWTIYLASKPGFISKEVYINDGNPGELHTVIYWNTLEEWKSIPLSELKETTKRFDTAFSSTYKITRRIHSEYDHKLYKVRHYGK